MKASHKTTALSAALMAVLATAPIPPRQAAAQISPAPPAAAPGSFADIIQRVAPAVVSIEARRPATPRTNVIQLFPELPFPFRFGTPPNEGQKLPDARIAGSGFFISASGYVVTNNHVIENATKVSVRLNDGRELDARIIGRDALTDLAVLKVEGGGFSYVTFETSARPRVGDWVIAMGNPFGLGGTATSGIVSADGRDIGAAYVDYLQIDAPINRGNSGGPTFDIWGRVIGVNTAIFSPSGGSIGIGFAIPAALADRITKQLIASGSITRGFIGATIQDLTPDIAESLGVRGRKGALVAEVTPGGPADKAGVKAGDAVLALNGQALNSNADLTRRVGQARPGDRLRLEVLREGRTLQLELVAGERPADAAPGRPSPEGDTVLGLSVRPLDPDTRRRLRLEAGQGGLVIEKVTPGSDAAEKGLRAGDVITRASGRDVANQADLKTAIAEARRLGREAVLLRVLRDGRSLFVPVAVSP
jgi:serine protease Do